jgi:hypothetical protein
MVMLVLPLTFAFAQEAAPPAAQQNRSDLFAVAVDLAGDRDGDGLSDLWVGDPSGPSVEDRRGRVWVVSTGSGRALVEILAPDGAHGFGWTLAALEDLDGDDIADVAIGAQSVSTGDRAAKEGGQPSYTRQGSGAVFAFSGAKGELLRSWLGPADWNKIPWYSSGAGPALASIGDWNADDVCDLAIGWSCASGEEPEQGRVSVVSGADGAVLHEWYGASAHDRFGYALARTEDVDGDGKSELAASAVPNYATNEAGTHPNLGQIRPGYVCLLSSKGAILYRTESGCRRFGHSLALVPSSEKDPSTLAVGQCFYSSTHEPCVHLLDPTDGERLGSLGRPPIEAWDGGWSRETVTPPPSRVNESFGSRVVPVRDFDGDGRPDLVVTAPQSFCMFPAAVLSRSSGEVLQHISIGEPPGTYPWEDSGPSHVGIAAVATGDLNGDEVDDFALAGASVRCRDCMGVVILFSGKDAKPFRWLMRKMLRD